MRYNNTVEKASKSPFLFDTLANSSNDFNSDNPYSKLKDEDQYSKMYENNTLAPSLEDIMNEYKRIKSKKVKQKSKNKDSLKPM
jgi:hypothetical protein